jgi:zinc transporter
MEKDDMVRHGLVKGLVLDGQGGARAVYYSQLAELQLQPQESLWLHWDRGHSRAQAWLREDSGLSEFNCDLLLEENTRPRLLTLPDDALLLFLRGLNLNPGADLEDMVSLRIYASAPRVISLRLRASKATEDVITDLEKGIGPKNASELVLFLALSLTARLDDVVEELAEQLDVQEDLLDTDSRFGIDQQKMVIIRRRAAGLRRFLVPQRDIYAQMARLRMPWFIEDDPDYWNELNNRLMRYLEELELIRERAGMVTDSERSRASERMNRTMYRFCIITGIFLPMSFLTGLLGINVGGIPGAENPWGFLIACGVIGAVAIMQLIVYRRLRWF